MKVHAMAIAAHALAVAVGAGEAAALAIEVKLRAERKGGGFLQEMPKNLGGKSTSTTLGQVGVSRNESSRWQAMARIPEERFEKVLADAKTRTQKAVLQVAKDLEQEINRESPLHVPLPEGGFRAEIIHGDFRFTDLKPNSFSLVLTDPPYGKDYLPLWEELGKIAQRVLIPGGWFVSYSGQTYLPEVLNSLSKSLSYHWIMALKLEDEHARIHGVKVFNEWKPILVFYKPPRQEREIHDMLISGHSDKRFHEWGQNPVPFEQLLEFFSNQGDNVLDPMAGFGSVVEACRNQKRKITAVELEADRCETMRKRFD